MRPVIEFCRPFAAPISHKSFSKHCEFSIAACNVLAILTMRAASDKFSGAPNNDPVTGVPSDNPNDSVKSMMTRVAIIWILMYLENIL